MLILKPNCEHCNKALSADSNEAHICSYECTFCTQCVLNVLDNVCPNCGGNFVKRPIRPKNAWRSGVSLEYQPASNTNYYKPVNLDSHQKLLTSVSQLTPDQR